MKKDLRGAAKTTHAINEYGGNRGMKAGLKKFADDNRKLGYQEAISDLRRASVINRLLGNIPKSSSK